MGAEEDERQYHRKGEILCPPEMMVREIEEANAEIEIGTETVIGATHATVIGTETGIAGVVIVIGEEMIDGAVIAIGEGMIDEGMIDAVVIEATGMRRGTLSENGTVGIATTERRVRRGIEREDEMIKRMIKRMIEND